MNAVSKGGRERIISVRRSENLKYATRPEVRADAAFEMGPLRRFTSFCELPLRPVSFLQPVLFWLLWRSGVLAGRF